MTTVSKSVFKFENTKLRSATFCPIVVQFPGLHSRQGTPCASLPVRGSAMRFRHVVETSHHLWRTRAVPLTPRPRRESVSARPSAGRFIYNMVSARTHCPYCHHSRVIPLNRVLDSPNVDFFRCDSCGRSWHVEKGKDGPPSQTLLGQQTVQKGRKQSADKPNRKSKR